MHQHMYYIFNSFKNPVEANENYFAHCKTNTNLIHIKFDINQRHPLIDIAIVFQHPIKGLWNKLHYQIEK